MTQDLMGALMCDNRFGSHIGPDAGPKPEERIAQLNELISVAENLYTDDGRELIVQSWTPSVDEDDPVHVTVKGLLRKVAERLDK